MEILATVNVDKDKAGWKSNAYMLFDYQSIPTSSSWASMSGWINCGLVIEPLMAGSSMSRA